MLEIICSRMIKIGLILCAAFALVTFFVEAPPLILTMSVILIALGLAIIAMYIKDTIYNLRRDRLDLVAQLIAGIIMVQCGNVGLRSTSITVRIAELFHYNLEWLRDTHFISWWLFFVAIGSVLHLTPIGSLDDNRIPPRNWWIISSAVIVAVFLSGLLLGLGLKSVGL